MTDSIHSLTEKEKEALLLLASGHSAKSSAKILSLSVHSVNDRLRGARRKLGVTNSREAARMVLQSDVGTGSRAPQSEDAPKLPWRVARNRWFYIVLATALSCCFILIPLGPFPLMSPLNSWRPLTSGPVDNAALVAAERWLAMGDASNWPASFDAAGRQFRDANTVERWANASRQVREPLGAMRSRRLVSHQWFNAPPKGYLQLRFRSDFENQANVLETVTLEKEKDAWRVVGILLD